MTFFVAVEGEEPRQSLTAPHPVSPQKNPFVKTSILLVFIKEKKKSIEVLESSYRNEILENQEICF